MTVRQIAVPARMKARSTLARIDYADAFEVDAAGPPTAEEWARTALEGAPEEMRQSLRWRWWQAFSAQHRRVVRHLLRQAAARAG